MTETNPQPSKENKTREPAYLEHWYKGSAYKIKNRTRLKVTIDGRFVIQLSKLFHCEEK